VTSRTPQLRNPVVCSPMVRQSPPPAKALAGLLAYSQLKPGGAGRPGEDYSERLENFFKPSAGGGPAAKGVIGALLTGA
jgi:hypothetical protein